MNATKISIAFPNIFFDLHQQISTGDVISFSAVTTQEESVTVTLKKRPDSYTDVTVEANNDDKKLPDSATVCNIKDITSEAFLTPAPADDEPNDVSIENQSANCVAVDTGFLLKQEPVVSGSAELYAMLHNGPLEEANAMTKNTTGLSAEVPQRSSPDSIQPLNTEQENSVHNPVTSQRDDDIADGIKAKPNLPATTIVTIGKRGKVTVSNGGHVEIVRDERAIIQDKAEQIDLGPDSLLDYESQRLQKVAAATTVMNAVSDTDTVSIGNQVDTDKTTFTDFEEDERELIAEVVTDNDVYVLTPEKLNKMMATRTERTRQRVPTVHDPTSLIEDYPIVREGNKYKCQKCGLLLLRKNYLISHMRYVHKVCIRTPMSLFVCHVCQRQFIRKSRLDEHIAHSHSDARPFRCDVPRCNRTFKTAYNLRDHKRLKHYHMLRYQCSKCCKQYENPNLMLKHYNECTRGEDGGEKTVEELRNPSWIPIEELFRRPVPTAQQFQAANIRKRGIKRKDLLDDDDDSEFVSSSSVTLPPEIKNITLADQSQIEIHFQDSVQLPANLLTPNITASAGDAADDADVIFSVQSLLTSFVHKKYTIDREELCRRIYGPETLNVHNVTDMVTSGAAPIGATAVTGASPAVGAGVAGAGSRLSEAQVKARLLAADFDCPACPPVTSAFSRLCEGEAQDLARDHAELINSFLSCDRLASTLVYFLTRQQSHDECTSTLSSAVSMFTAVKQTFSAHMSHFDLVTHTLGSKVIGQVIDLSVAVCGEAVTKCRDVRHSLRDLDTSNAKLARDSANERLFATVDGLLTGDNTYPISVDEIRRRTEFPEQMSVSLLHRYLRRLRHDYNNTLKRCVDVGVELQMKNKSNVTSRFSLITEEEARELGADFKRLLSDYVDVNDLYTDVSASLQNAGVQPLTSEQFSFVVTSLKRTLDNECRHYDLVTHGVGARWIDVSLDLIRGSLDVASAPSDVMSASAAAAPRVEVKPEENQDRN